MAPEHPLSVCSWMSCFPAKVTQDFLAGVPCTEQTGSFTFHRATCSLYVIRLISQFSVTHALCDETRLYLVRAAD